MKLKMTGNRNYNIHKPNYKPKINNISFNPPLTIQTPEPTT